MSKLVIFLVTFTYIGFLRTIIHTRAIERLEPGDQLKLPSRICSPNSTYCMSFREMGDGNTYLATYNATDDSTKWILWAANRDEPLTVAVSDSATLTLDHSGVLKITRQVEEPIILYSSTQSQSQTHATRNNTNNTVAALLDSGNFVLQQVNTDGSKTPLWQSFDYPTNTLFPGMKLGVNHKTGSKWSLVSYFLVLTPSSGPFSLEWEPKIAQLVIRRRGQVYWASGELKNNTFENIPVEAQHNIEYLIVSNEDEDSIMFTARSDQYSAAPWKLSHDGMLFDMSGNRIARAGECYGYNNDGGCQKWEVPKCRQVGEKFATMSIVINDAEKTSNDTAVNSTTSDCKAACWSNCDCVGFTYLYNNKTGCYFVNGNSWQNIQNASGTMFFMLDERTASSPPKTSPVSKDKSVEESRKANANSKKWKWIIPVIIIALFIIFGFVSCLVRKRMKLMLEVKKRTRLKHTILQLDNSNGYYDAKENQDALKHVHDLTLYSYASIMEATNGFSSTNKLGEGGFGPVYKGILMQKEVAVKRLSKSSRQGVAEFKTELKLVSELQHTNLVQLLGCCIHKHERLLIYEYMPNKSLDFFLFDSARSKLLDWKKRLNIIEGIAQGLLYLHKYSRLRIVHRDLKASNILLDEYMNPKISDFGMARIFMEESEENTSRIVGTYGYMPPEYAMRGVFSRKLDVYSFGVLLLEIVSGRRNNSFSNASNPMNLVGHFWEFWNKGQALQLMDSAIHDSFIQDQVLRCIHVGLLAVEERAIDRPTMSQILSLLSNSFEILPLLKKPAFYFGEIVNSVNESHRQNIDSINVVSVSAFSAR